MFYLVFTKVLKICFYPIANLVEYATGYGYPTWIRKCLKASSYIDTLTIDVFAIIDNIAQVDGHSKVKRTCPEACLHFYSTIDGVLYRREFC